MESGFGESFSASAELSSSLSVEFLLEILETEVAWAGRKNELAEGESNQVKTNLCGTRAKLVYKWYDAAS
ncbi:MAG: hypothetical protein ABIQ35_12660 [Verrucomicrobiota bacterium]